MKRFYGWKRTAGCLHPRTWVAVPARRNHAQDRFDGNHGPRGRGIRPGPGPESRWRRRALRRWRGGGWHGGGNSGGGWHGGGNSGGGWHGGNSGHGGNWHGSNWHGSGWHGGHYYGSFYFGPGFYWGYPYYYPYYSSYYYPAYDYGYGYAPAYSAPTYTTPPATYQYSAPSATYQYYCPSSGGYYPSVPTCSEAWLRVVPN